MTTVKLATLMLVLAAGPALGQSVVSFELELGGDNHGAHCASGGNILFTAGSPSEGQVQALGSTITWDARVLASGVQQSGNGAGHAVKGVANFVFDLELYKDSIAPENLATDAVFESSTNDGDDGCVTAAAAFAFSMNAFSLGPGRVIDPLQGTLPKFSGGPNMDVYTYPNAAWQPGILLGMGAGYSKWNRTGGGALFTTAGVGQPPGPGDPTAGTLGTGPVCEGQIDTSSLSAGTYILRLVPGAGINVLRGDINLAANQNAFAVAADQVQEEETITFTLASAANPPTWASVRFHAGDVQQNYAIPLDSADANEPTSESRVGVPVTFENGIQQIVVDFASSVLAAYNGAGTITVVGGLNVDSHQLVNGDTRLEIDVSGSVNDTCYKIDISGVIDHTQVPGMEVDDTTCSVRAKVGDSSGGVGGVSDGLTNLIDANDVYNRSSITPITEDLARFDTNTDGVINLIDYNEVYNLNSAFKPPCP